MVGDFLETVARERALTMRDIAFMQENVKDAPIQEAVFQYECAEQGLILESEQVSEETKKEISEALENVKIDKAETDKEIDKIISSENDLTYDEVIGVGTGMVDDSEKLLDSVADLVQNNDIESPVE